MSEPEQIGPAKPGPTEAPLPATPVQKQNWVECELCGSPVLALHCKLRCGVCGAIRDCSDL